MADKKIQVWATSGDYAAVFVDGKREDIGDLPDVLERLLERMGVEFVWSESFLLGQHSASGAAQTTSQIAEYDTQRENARARLAEIQAEAAKIKKGFNL